MVSLGVLLAAPVPELAELGLADAAARARSKLVESLPDPVRATVRRSQDRVRFAGHPVRLLRSTDEWAVVDEESPDRCVPQRFWGRVNVSALGF